MERYIIFRFGPTHREGDGNKKEKIKEKREESCK